MALSNDEGPSAATDRLNAKHAMVSHFECLDDLDHSCWQPQDQQIMTPSQNTEVANPELLTHQTSIHKPRSRLHTRFPPRGTPQHPVPGHTSSLRFCNRDSIEETPSHLYLGAENVILEMTENIGSQYVSLCGVPALCPTRMLRYIIKRIQIGERELNVDLPPVK